MHHANKVKIIKSEEPQSSIGDLPIGSIFYDADGLISMRISDAGLRLKPVEVAYVSLTNGEVRSRCASYTVKPVPRGTKLSVASG